MKHPAKFTSSILAAIEPLLPKTGLILDPFAGTGRIHELARLGEAGFDRVTFGVEIEPEWAAMHDRTFVGNALDMMWRDEAFDAIVTSPTYGNRMADHHEPKDSSRRITYRHMLGRPLHHANSGQLQWGRDYQSFHRIAWSEAIRVLKPGGLFVLNIADHVRKGQVERVSLWHWEILRYTHGLENVAVRKVRTPGMRFGQNGAARVGHEWVIAMRKPAA